MSRNERKNSVDSLMLLAASHVSLDYTYSGRPRKPNFLCDDALIYDRLQKAALACETINNLSMLAELKNLIEESIELFRIYHRLDDTRQQLTPVSAESPTSSMYPQLGIVEKKLVTAPLLETGDYMVPDLSVLSIDTDDNSDMRQSCMNLKPFRRLGNQLALLFCNVGRHEEAQRVDPIPGSEAPLSPSLQFFISRHRAPPSTLPLHQLVYEENCRSTDADCDHNEVRYWTVDDFIPESLNGGVNSDIEKDKSAPVNIHAADQMISLPIKSMKARTPIGSLSKAHKVLLLKTATAIGLSLCRAFLIWKKAMLQYLRRHFSVLRSDEEDYPSFQDRNTREIHKNETSYSPSSARPLVISIGLLRSRNYPGDDDGDSNLNYDCDSNNGSNCDSNNSCDAGICGVGNCSSSNSSSGSSVGGSVRSSSSSALSAQEADLNIDKDPYETSLIRDSEKYLEKSTRQLRYCTRRHSHHKDGDKLGNRVAITSDNLDVDALNPNRSLGTEKSSPKGSHGKWLICLNTSDVIDGQNPQHSNDRSFGPSCRFDYEEVFDDYETRSSSKHQRNHRGAMVPACIARVDASDSDSDSDAEMKLCSRSASHCYRAPSEQFAESNPISKVMRPRNNCRSVSFDGGCMPTQLFDRRRRSMSIPLAVPKQVRVNSALEISDVCPPPESSPILLPSLEYSEKHSSIASDTSSPFTFNSGFDFKKCVAFINESKCNLITASSIISSPLSRKSMNFLDPPEFRDCFGSLREPLELHSHLPARQEQYRAIGPVVRTNELALWAIFAQFPMTCCDINLEMTSSALAVHNYSCHKPLLSFANLRSLLSSFGICPAICSESELSEHLKEMKIATSPPSSPFFVASPIKVCSFESFVKILWLVASERMLMTAATTTASETSDLQSQVRFAMILHQMDISEGRENLSQSLMKSSIRLHISGVAPLDECMSPQSPVSRTFREPLLPLPPFDLSVLKEARAGATTRKMLVCEGANKTKMKMKKKMIAKFNNEISSGIATDSSSLSDF